jgi:hypothetical protein
MAEFSATICLGLGFCIYRVFPGRFSVHPTTSRFKKKAAFESSERSFMKRFLSISLGICIALLMVVGSERRAWGYVDPGSGLIAIQGIASVAAAYVYMVRRRIAAFFTRKKRESAPLPVATKTGETREIA